MTDAVERMDPRCDAGGHGYMLWMEYRDDGGYVRASDYDTLAAKLAAAERRERQLLDTTATCRMLLRELNTAKAKLAEAEAEVWEQRDLRNHQCKLKLEAMARAEAAEAALASMQSDALAFVLFLDENYRHSFGDIARKKIRAFYARIQTGEKE